VFFLACFELLFVGGGTGVEDTGGADIARGTHIDFDNPDEAGTAHKRAQDALKRSFDEMSDSRNLSTEDQETEERYRELWRQRILNLNTEFLKLSASCSKTLQPSDVMSGFLNIHQFLNSAQFRLFDPSKMPLPSEWTVVENIMRGKVQAASRDTFKRFFYAKDYLIDTCLNKSNILQGYLKTGFNRIDGGAGPDYVKILKCCPTIVDKCPPNKADADLYYAGLLGKCHTIAQEISRDPYSCGTPDDGRMEEAFAEQFGRVHIGTNEHKSSHSRVTELEFIRWRATVFGTPGQRILSAIRERTVTPNDTATTVRAPSGKFCSNTSCPMKSRYQAATCKTLWRKCQKDCVICNGRTHVCPHLDCSKIIDDHTTSSR